MGTLKLVSSVDRETTLKRIIFGTTLKYYNLCQKQIHTLVSSDFEQVSRSHHNRMIRQFIAPDISPFVSKICLSLLVNVWRAAMKGIDHVCNIHALEDYRG